MSTELTENNDLDNFESTTQEKRRIGRPSKYSNKMATQIALLVGEGNSLRKIASMEGYPSLATILRWQIEFPDFREAVGWMKWLHSHDLGQQAIEAIDDVDLEGEDAAIQLRKAQAKARALIDAAKLLDLKSSPFGGENNEPVYK
ncbi:hypothetical protein ABJ684_001241 [Escherichia coli]|uniref:terminase small subunit-like protein n=2 Tax=Escherichia coli TaxID=562 RepID=UPI000FBD4883|nr:hypothetical protein [Escherichia coli]ELO0558593.1 hypothetical protein [Escherichia coli O8]EFA3655444.1 hypothetical protein [Escherichia coli]EFB9896364.1 hypothetical protein [Escherichia coli]EFG5616050.1 hypothetical protein [Escherichia coli]EFI0057649.1 hypothetical protein [Escherichia coli]